MSIEFLTSQYRGIDLEEEEHVELDDSPQTGFESKLFKSIKAFSNKLNSLKKKPKSIIDPSLKKQRVE